jgi:DNA-binding NarL/FixJ family response regulator
MSTNIFIVDDEPLLREMLSDHLKNEYPTAEISSFPTGEDCLAYRKAKPDVVILDFHLNSRETTASDGLDILDQLKARDKSTPVIMLSSQKSYGTAAQTIAHGAIHYVIKGQEAFDEISKLVAANSSL